MAAVAVAVVVVLEVQYVAVLIVETVAAVVAFVAVHTRINSRKMFVLFGNTPGRYSFTAVLDVQQ